MGNAGGIASARRASSTGNQPQLYGDPTSMTANGAAIQYTHAQMQALYMNRGRADMGFIQSQLQSVMQAAPEMQETTTVRNDVNLKKQSLKLQPMEHDEFQLAFLFDGAKPCTISLYFHALETIDGEGNSTFENQKPHLDPSDAPRVYPAQLGQAFTSPALDLASWTPAERVYKEDTNVFPMVVEIKVFHDGANLKTQKQSTFLMFPPMADGKLKVQVIKQKVEVEGQTYELQEIYGMEGACCAAPKPTATGAVAPDMKPSDEVLEGAECIICMCEPRNTTILPCRHLCICAECSEALKRPGSTCPICRGKVESMLQIRVNNTDADQSNE
ncbi:Aste57867_13302 [Aphanomyces stellatus]|uniref:RING-type E3 ubiquitin transferase n=1 Tax=Aphanomyces stellatus TaxID=120398 RepID=A0A485KYG9_9STRA|nr:hypothetical protein As57867_013253 [Aphanomyces stellatus]VFT90141.1 Aste57867_13302 [Aphanomyces stellatus]